MNRIRLSIEEMAYVLGWLGGEQQAAEFLKPLLGEVDAKELTGRLLSAAHSLLARGWLVMEGEEKALNPEVQILIGSVLQSQYSLRFSKIARGEETTTTCFFSGPLIVEYRLDQAVVCHLEVVPDRNDLFRRSAQFMQVPEGSQTSPLGTLSADALQDARAQAEIGKVHEAVKLLERGGLKTAAPLLAKDMASVQWRGWVLKFQPTSESVTSEEGFLVLQGPQQMWLFEITGPSNLNVLPGNQKNFRTLLGKLVEG